LAAHAAATGVLLTPASAALPARPSSRTAGAAGGVLLALQLDADGNAIIYGRTGVQIATTRKNGQGIQGLTADSQPAYVGRVDSDLPADIAALALGDLLDTSGDPHIPDQALVVASAMTWLR
jgi:hypothetical protein